MLKKNRKKPFKIDFNEKKIFILVIGFCALIVITIATMIVARAGAFTYKGDMEVKVIDYNGGSFIPINNARVQVKVIGANVDCPRTVETTDANGIATFKNCPAYSKGIKKYRLVDVSASGYSIRENSNYKKATSGFYLYGKGRKKTRIRVYMHQIQAARPTRPTRPPNSSTDPWGSSPNNNTPAACRTVLAPGVKPLAWSADPVNYRGIFLHGGTL